MEDGWWFCRRTSSAPEEPGRVAAAANLSKRAWRPACERDILAAHSMDTDKFDPELPARQLQSRLGRESDAQAMHSSLPPSPSHGPGMQNPLGARRTFSFSTSSSASSLPDLCARSGRSSTTQSSQASPASSHRTYRGAPISDLYDCRSTGMPWQMGDCDDVDLQIVPQGGHCGDSHAHHASDLDHGCICDPGDNSPAPLPGYQRMHFVWGQ